MLSWEEPSWWWLSLGPASLFDNDHSSDSLPFPESWAKKLLLFSASWQENGFGGTLRKGRETKLRLTICYSGIWTSGLMWGEEKKKKKKENISCVVGTLENLVLIILLVQSTCHGLRQQNCSDHFLPASQSSNYQHSGINKTALHELSK